MTTPVPSKSTPPSRLYRYILQLFNGKTNNVASVTLDASAATTTLTDARIGPSSHIGFTALTANAAAEAANLYVTARGDGSCTINHGNDADTDKTYSYVVVG